MHKGESPQGRESTREEIAANIEKLGPWFHKIELPHGLTTKTETTFGEPADHPLSTWEYVKQVLPEDLSGKRVLDIGCNGGFYSIEANKRGGIVTGAEAKRWHVRQATYAAQTLGLENIRFKRRSLYELNPEEDGTYDVVMALGLIYHLKHLIRGLEILFDVCSDLLILETEVLYDENQKAGKLDDVVDNYIVHYQKNDPFKDEAAYNWFFPSAETVRAMLEDVGFVDVAIRSRFGARAVLTARKKQLMMDSRFPAFVGTSITVDKKTISCRPGEDIAVQISARNTGRGYWLGKGSTPDGKGVVGLFLYLFSEDDPVFGRDFPRYQIEKDVQPGEEKTWKINLKAPESPGKYSLEVDLLVEHYALFQDVGNSPAFIEIEVTP